MKKKNIIFAYILYFIMTININVYAADESCKAWLGGEGKTYTDLHNIFKYMKILAPLLVIGLSIYEYIEALVNKDPDEYKKVNKKLIKRLILVAALFFLPVILDLLLSLINPQYSTCIE